jgi:hypothetical protein
MGKSSQSVDNIFRSLILQILQILKPREADLGCEKVSASIPPLGVKSGLRLLKGRAFPRSTRVSCHPTQLPW